MQVISELKNRRQCFTAVLLFALIAHAFFVSSTHHHRSKGLEREAQVSGAFANSGESSGAQALSNDASCLSCRLQRGFVFDASQTTAFEPQPLPQSLQFELSYLEPVSTLKRLLLSDRAPPRS